MNHTVDEVTNLSDHLPIMMSITIPVQPCNTDTAKTDQMPKLRWNKIPQREISNYTSRLATAVDRMAETRGSLCDSVCTDNQHCTDETCRYFIQQEYDDLITCLKLADADLPRHKPGLRKDWWNEELSDLKAQSLQIHAIWVADGRPRSGPIQLERLKVKCTYKRR